MRFALPVAALFMLAAGVADAGPADYIHTPVIERGELDFDAKAGAVRLRDGRSASALALAVEYGFSARWSSELVANWEREAGGPNRCASWELENRFLLLDADDHPVGAALLLEVERARYRDEGDEVRFGPLLQADFGRLRTNLNLLLERRLHAAQPSNTEFLYRWQLRWREGEALNWGAQGFGETGRWNDSAPRSQQSHRLGPAVFGKLAFGDDDGVPFNAALLFGTGGAAPRHSARVQLSYGF